MATAFGYVEREADSYVNWADVGRDMSNTIDDIQRVREEKKGLIEKTYREDLKFIADNPNGEHESIRAWSLGVANNSAEMMRQQNTLLKQGKLNLNNYLTFRQNLTDSVEKIYTVNSQLQEAFKEVNDRSKANANQLLERETKVLLEKYGKLEDTEAYVNPLNGTIYLGLTEIVDEDGKSVRRLKKGEGTYLSPDELQAAVMQKFDNYDEQPDLDKWVEGTGAVEEDIQRIGGESFAGLVISVTDVTSERILQKAKELPEGSKLSPDQMAALEKYVNDFNKGEIDFIDGILKNEYNASALLTEKIKGKDGNVYNIVFNKADQKTEYDIYVDKTDSKFTPVFDEKTDAGKKQKEVLTNYLRGQLRVKYDRKVEMKPYNEPVPPRPIVQGGDGRSTEWYGGLKTYNDKINMYENIFTGNADQKENALINLRQSEGVASATIDKNGIFTVTPSNKDKPAITFDFNNPRIGKDGKPLSTRELVFTIMEVADPGTQAKYGGYVKTVSQGELNTEIGEFKDIDDTEKEIAKLKNESKNLTPTNPLRVIEIKKEIEDAQTKLKNLQEEQRKRRERLKQGQGNRGELNEK